MHFAFFYDELLAHLVYAGCDFIAVPSVSEPCRMAHKKSHPCYCNAVILFLV